MKRSARHAPVPLLALIAALAPCMAQEAPPEPPPPAAIPVEEEVPEIPPAPVPEVVAPGGNVPRPSSRDAAISGSGMFRVRGGDPASRASVALGLEQVRGDFLDLLLEREKPGDTGGNAPRGIFRDAPKTSDRFVVPVDVELLPPPADGARPPGQQVEYGLTIVDSSFALGIRIHPDPGIDQELLERAAFTVLLYERSLRGVKPDQLDDTMLVRPWLVDGLIEARKWSQGRADRRLYEGVFRQGGGFTMDELFELSERSLNQLDSASRLSFRVLSGALVMALVEQPQGKPAFNAFCSEAARHSGEMPVLLRRHFPELNLSEQSLAKWWALTLAKLSQSSLTEVLSIVATESELTAALKFRLADGDGGLIEQGMEAWSRIQELDEAERAEAVRPAEDALVRLSYRCFPSYRPLIREYLQFFQDLRTGKGKDLAGRVGEFSEQRLVRAQRASQARDYLDFMVIQENSSEGKLSGQFQDYMQLKKELEARPRPERNDRLSAVLDTIQKAYEPRKKRR